MKKSLNIFVLAAALVVAQACGSKSEKDSEESTATETAAVETSTPPKLTLAEKRVILEKERAAKEEQRRIAYEERIKTSPTYVNSSGKIVYNKAEVDPQFNGGNKALMEYLHDNLVFPKEAEEKELEGTVYVDFVVADDGTVREIEVTDATSEEVDQSFRNEAIRVIASMPKWVAGRQHGKPVDVKFSLPISFEIR